MANGDDIVQKIVVQADTSGAQAQVTDLSTKLVKMFEGWTSSVEGANASLASFGGVIGVVGIGLGVAAGAAIALGAALAKVAFSATDSAEALGRMAAVTGGSVQNLSGMSLALQSFGASSKDVENSVTSLSQRIVTEMPKIAEEVVTSAEAITKAQDAVATASARAQQALTRQQGLGLQSQELATQVKYQSELQKVEQDRVDLAEKLAKGTISATDAAKKHQQITKDTADLNARMLPEQQAAQRATLALREQELADQNELFKAEQQTFAARKAAAQQKVYETEANDLQMVINQFQRLSQGVHETFDALTTMETKTKAVVAAMAQFSDPEQRLTEFLAIFDNMKNREEAFALAAILGFTKFVQGVGEGESALARYQARRKALHDSGLEETKGEQQSLSDLSLAWNRLSTDVGALKDKLGALVAPAITAALNGIAAAIEFIGNVIRITNEQLDKFGLKLTDLLSPITVLTRAVEYLLQKLGILGSTPVPGSGTAPPDTSGLPFASGGLVRGPGGGDVIPALLSAGEFVLSQRAVSRLGVGWLSALNSLQMPKFATGGLVLPTPSTSTVSGRALTLVIEGRSFGGLTMSDSAAASLERFAVHSQIASTGRKPSWRR